MGAEGGASQMTPTCNGAMQGCRHVMPCIIPPAAMRSMPWQLLIRSWPLSLYFSGSRPSLMFSPLPALKLGQDDGAQGSCPAILGHLIPSPLPSLHAGQDDGTQGAGRSPDPGG